MIGALDLVVARRWVEEIAIVYGDAVHGRTCSQMLKAALLRDGGDPYRA